MTPLYPPTFKKTLKNADTALFFAEYNFYTHIYLMCNLLGFIALRF